MNPYEFLTVANNLKNSPREAERRTAVSRAYYAVYHIIKTYLTRNGVYIPEVGHGKIILYISQSGIPEAEELGDKIDDLRKERNRADYKLKLRKFNKRTCNLLVAKAQEIIKVFERCKGRPLIDGINNYKKLIGEA